MATVTHLSAGSKSSDRPNSPSRKRDEAWKVSPGAKRGRKPPPPNESARDRFVRIGNRRMNGALRSIALIGNLASSNYAWTPEDLDAMHSSLMDAIEKAFQRFEVRKRPPRAAFSFG